jgi:hypothetical protein
MIVASPLNGGADLTGKSGRKTADACDAIAKETKIRTAARFIFAAKNAFYRRSTNAVQSRCQPLLWHVGTNSFVGASFAKLPICMSGLILSPANRKRL